MKLFHGANVANISSSKTFKDLRMKYFNKFIDTKILIVLSDRYISLFIGLVKHV
jgi:hypothetical protein